MEKPTPPDYVMELTMSLESQNGDSLAAYSKALNFVRGLETNIVKFRAQLAQCIGDRESEECRLQTLLEQSRSKQSAGVTLRIEELKTEQQRLEGAIGSTERLIKDAKVTLVNSEHGLLPRLQAEGACGQVKDQYRQRILKHVAAIIEIQNSWGEICNKTSQHFAKNYDLHFVLKKTFVFNLASGLSGLSEFLSQGQDPLNHVLRTIKSEGK